MTPRPLPTHIWFRTSLPLIRIARGLGWRRIHMDSENEWEWVLGDFVAPSLDDVSLDICRLHTLPASHTDTMIYRVDRGGFDPDLQRKLMRPLKTLVGSPIFCGAWENLGGNDFEKTIYQEI